MSDEKDIKKIAKKLNRLYLPWVSRDEKRKIIDEVGIKKIVEDYGDYIRAGISISYHQLTNAIIKNAKDYILQEMIDSDYVDYESKMCSVFLDSFYSSHKNIKEYIDLMPGPVALNMFRNGHIKNEYLNKVAKRKKVIVDEIIEEVNSGNYTYIKDGIPSKIGNKIAKLDKKIIIDLIKTSKVDLFTKKDFYEEHKAKIQKIIKEDIETNKQDYIWYLQENVPIVIKKFVLKEVKLSDKECIELVKYANIDHGLYELIYRHRRDIIQEVIKEEVQNGEYGRYLIKDNKDVFKIVVDSLSNEQLLDIFTSDKYYSCKEAMYELRKNDIDNILLKGIEDNRKILFKIINFSTPKGIFELLKKVTFTAEEYRYLLSKAAVGTSAFNQLYEVKADEIKRIVEKDIALDRKNLYNYLTFSTPDDLVYYLVTIMTDEEILDLYTNEHKVYFGLKDLYIHNSSRIFPILNKERKRNHSFTRKLVWYEIPELTSKLLEDITEEEIIEIFDLLSEETYMKLYKNHEESLKKVVRELYKEPHDFCAKMFCSKADNELVHYAFSLLTPDDFFRIMTEPRGYSSKVLTCCNKKYKLYVYDIISKKMEEFIIKKDIDSFIKYSNNLFFTYKGLFYTLFEHIDMDEALVIRLFNESSYSDLQKNKIYEKHKDKIMSYIVKEIDRDINNAKIYLNSATPNEVIEYIISFLGYNKLKEVLDTMVITTLSSKEEVFLSKLYVKTYKEEKNAETVLKLIENLSSSQIRLAKFFEDIQDFLVKIGINPENFWQYSLNVKYDYINDIMLIILSNIDDFKRVKDYFYSNIFKDDKFSYSDLFLLTNNYNRYKELCMSLVNENKTLTPKEISNLMLLFNKKETIDPKPTKIAECNNITNIIKDKYKILVSRKESIDSLKNTLCLMLFNSSLMEMKEKLENYGSTEELIKLEFNNRTNSDNIIKLIRNAEEYTKIIEYIIESNSKEEIYKLAKAILLDYDQIVNLTSKQDFDEIMRRLYANETNANLTKITDGLSRLCVMDDEKTRRNGVETYDFSDKKYVLYAHVKSSTESVEELINGKASGDKNFMSFSAISNRMQSYYYGGRASIIFGYDEIPVKNFIYSSNSNLGSNGAIRKNSTEYSSIYQKERGILETSDTTGNSEILCFREGIKPKYIIIPKDRRPTLEEITIAKNYGLKFVVTQNIGEHIENPKTIHTEENIDEYELADLKALKEKIESIKKEKSKDVAVLTDVHALFEPLLAVLEDARKKGITEIYSLGDNIGTGPNPKEVLELLERYNVKSVKGNHEEYVTEGVDAFKTHLQNIPGAYEEAKDNVEYTKSKLTKQQLEKLKNYPNKREVVVNGKKILLTHFTKDYNSEEQTVDQKDYEYVLQGHIHFKSQSDNVVTLKGVGIGNSASEDVGKATYYVLSPENEYVRITENSVPFDIENTNSEIDSNDFNTKRKIKSWIGK